MSEAMQSCLKAKAGVQSKASFSSSQGICVMMPDRERTMGGWEIFLPDHCELQISVFAQRAHRHQICSTIMRRPGW